MNFLNNFLRSFRKCENIKEAYNKTENKTNFFIIKEHMKLG